MAPLIHLYFISFPDLEANPLLNRSRLMVHVRDINLEEVIHQIRKTLI